MGKNKTSSKKIYNINKLTKKNNRPAIEGTDPRTSTNRTIGKNNKATRKSINTQTHRKKHKYK